MNICMWGGVVYLCDTLDDAGFHSTLYKVNQLPFSFLKSVLVLTCIDL